MPNNNYYGLRNDEDQEDSFISSAPEASNLYSEFFLGKLASLRKQMEEIDLELEARSSIHKHLVQEIDDQILSASLFLDRLKHWAIGYRVGVDMERNLWERAIADLTKQKRTEIVRCWRDSIGLKEDRRELSREYEELLKRQCLLR